MAWARLDDGFAEHPKVRRAWRQNRGAVGLYAMAIAYSARYETDGRIDADWIAEKVPDDQERNDAVQVLLEVGLVEATGTSLLIHDFLVYNRSKAEMDEERVKARERQRTLRAKQQPAPPQVNGTASKPRRGRRDRVEDSKQKRANDFAWCEEHVPDLPTSIAAAAMGVIRLGGRDITPDAVRERVVARMQAEQA